MYFGYIFSYLKHTNRSTPILFCLPTIEFYSSWNLFDLFVCVLCECLIIQFTYYIISCSPHLKKKNITISFDATGNSSANTDVIIILGVGAPFDAGANSAPNS